MGQRKYREANKEKLREVQRRGFGPLRIKSELIQRGVKENLRIYLKLV